MSPNGNVTKLKLSIPFGDGVALFKSELKVLKEHMFPKRVQKSAYQSQKASITINALSVHVSISNSNSVNLQKATRMANRMLSRVVILGIKDFRNLETWHCGYKNIRSK